jgi:hypothetical protein
MTDRHKGETTMTPTVRETVRPGRYDVSRRCTPVWWREHNPFCFAAVKYWWRAKKQRTK